MPTRVFIGAAKEDSNHVETLKKHLKVYERQNLIQIWDESMLVPGEVRNAKIQQELNLAEIVLLLFSSDLLAEDFIYGTEMNHILDKVKQNKVRLIPILLRPSGFSDSPFAAYSPVPDREKSITQYSNKDDAWTIVVEQIKRAIQSSNHQKNQQQNHDAPLSTIPQSLKDQVNAAISSNRAANALDLIIQWAHQQQLADLKTSATVLKSSLDKLQRQELLGLLSFSESSRESSKINYGILELMNLKPETSPEPIPNANPNPQPPAEEKLKILMLTANPAGMAELDLREEQLMIRERLQDHFNRFNLKVIDAVDKIQFKEKTETEKPNILHFSGHGENEGIVLQNNQRNDKDLLPLSGLEILFKYFVRTKKLDLKAVVLNACFTDTQAEVIARYVPFVIGTTLDIGDRLAIAFSAGFYFSLFAESNLDIEQAFHSGMTQAALDGANESHFIMYKNGVKVDLND